MYNSRSDRSRSTERRSRVLGNLKVRMNLNIAGLTLPVTPGTSRDPITYTVMRCEDCDQIKQDGEPRCDECGALLIKETRTEEDNGENTDQLGEREWEALIDFLGEDFRELIDEQRGLRAPSRTIEEAFLNTLGKIEVNSRGSILYDVDIRLGPFHAMLVPASFSALMPGTITKGLVKGVPEYGESSMMHPELYKDKIMVLTRGKVSFATKAKVAMEAGCAGLLVVQTLDVWPFEMSDQAGELGDTGEVNIPMFMISKGDAALVHKLYENDSKNAPHICVREQVRECSICQEVFDRGEIVMKLHCRHLYHAACVQSWLKEHNTCPLCRIEMPKAAPGKARRSEEAEVDAFFARHQAYRV